MNYDINYCKMQKVQDHLTLVIKDNTQKLVSQ